MKKLLLSALAVFTASQMNAQITIFEDSFEDYEDFIITNVGDWLTLDIDGSETYAGGSEFAWSNKFQPQAFQVFNPAAAEVTNSSLPADTRNFDPRPGSQKYMACWAAVMPGDGEDGSGDGPNDDWLVSPAITLGVSGNTLKFWVKSLSTSFGLETYRVAIYVGDGVPSGPMDFVYISGPSDLEAPFPDWEEKIFDLDNYSGETIRFAVHCNSVDRYMFMVDDFSVETTALSTNDFFSKNFAVYPNPANEIINLQSNSGLIIESATLTDINGRTVAVMQANGASNTSMNIADLSAGVYILNVSSNEGTGTAKIVKK